MTYPGGKAGSGVYQKIINQIPPHDVYISPFLGHDAVLLQKRPATVSIGIDSDATIINFWLDQLAKKSDGGSRLPGVIVKHGDAISFLKSYQFKGGEFIYADPPYLWETRRSKRRIYHAEFGDTGQHKKLLTVLKSLPCMVAISGYQSSLYSEMLQGWRTIHYNTVTRSGKVAVEFLWMNYETPKELHDYRYLGENFRQRERLKRIRTRWLARLKRMDPLEQYMLRSAIAEYGEHRGAPETAMLAGKLAISGIVASTNKKSDSSCH
jgi:DNA adenine methylase